MIKCMKNSRFMTDLLVYGPSHVVNHWETADGLQEVIIWPKGSIYMYINMNEMEPFSFLFSFLHHKMHT